MSQFRKYLPPLIILALFEIVAVTLWLTKDNPPMGADCQGAGVEMHWKK